MGDKLTDDQARLLGVPSSRPTAQTALMEAEMKGGPLVDPARALSDQEIRARALECAVLFCGLPAVPAEDTNLMVVAQQFKAYIRDGVT